MSTVPTNEELAASLSNLQAAVDALNTKLAQLPVIPVSVEYIASTVVAAVVERLLASKGLAGYPDDMGLPAEFQLGQPLQNYFVWSARNGAAWALSSPEVLLGMAAAWDAMASATTPAGRVSAAQKALDDLKRTLHG